MVNVVQWKEGTKKRQRKNGRREKRENEFTFVKVKAVNRSNHF